MRRIYRTEQAEHGRMDKTKPASQPDDRAVADQSKLRYIGEALRHITRELASADLPTEIQDALDRLTTRH